MLIASREVNILLVEDSSINQRLISSLLAKRGWKIRIAQNGKKALEELTAHFFHVILMDIEMPMMDGFETTIRIREKEKELGTHIPIIALTAHTQRDDKERCLQVGMDDYIKKPINRDHLYAVIEKVLSCHLREEEKDRTAFRDGQVMLQKLGGDEELLEEIGGIFLEELPEVLLQLKEALSEKDLVTVKKMAHGLKGVLGNMGAERAYKLALHLEKACQGSSLEEVQELFSSLVEQMKGIQSFFSRREQGNG